MRNICQSWSLRRSDLPRTAEELATKIEVQDRPDLQSSFLNLPRYELNAWDDGSMKLRGMMMPANTLGVEPEGVAKRQGAKPQHHILNTRYGSRYFAGIASQQHTSNQLVSGNPCFHFFKPVSSTETPVSSRHTVRNFVPIVLSGTQDRREEW
jgi:hypothetical protein